MVAPPVIAGFDQRKSLDVCGRNSFRRAMSISLVIARRRPKVVDEVTPSSRGAREAGDVATS